MLLKFDPQNPQEGRREVNSQRCLLTTHVLLLHTHRHTHKNKYFNYKSVLLRVMKYCAILTPSLPSHLTSFHLIK